MIAIAVPATSCAARAGTAQQAQAIDYMLDDALGKIALYPAPGYRSYLPSKYMVPSLEELEGRVSQLPPGTRLHWTPYKRDPPENQSCSQTISTTTLRSFVAITRLS
jgi:hypothetical protein